MTNVETGLPGSPNSSTGGSFERFASPKANGLPGCTATRQRSTVPSAPNASRTTSYGPTDTPPLTMIASAVATPWASRSRTSASRSCAIPRSIASAPDVMTSARRPGPFASGIPAAPSGCPGARISSPVASTATRGRRRTRTRSTAEPASREIRAGLRVIPGSRSRSPPARSLPACRIEPPTVTARYTATRAGSGPVASRPRGPVAPPSAPTGVVSSTGTTASAPSGRGAPVAMRTAVPRPTTRSGAEPARTSPTTARTTGLVSCAPATSADRIA